MFPDLPPDILAFFGVLLRGSQLTAQAFVLGGVMFVIGVTRPMAARLAGTAERLEGDGLRWTAWSAFALAAIAVAAILDTLAQLAAGLNIPPAEAIGADFVGWNVFMAVAALAAGIAALRTGRGSVVPLLLAALAIPAGSVLSSHAYARLDDRAYFIAAGVLHQLGACLWIGGIPFMLAALARLADEPARLAVGMRFSNLFTGAVACLLLGAAMLAWGYIATPGALIGTAYGIMTGAKIALMAVLLFLGAMNRRSTHGQAADTGLFRLRRFAEVEIGIGITVLMIAASMASQPPAIDQAGFQATVSEIAERMLPDRMPRFVSPDSATLSMGNIEQASEAQIVADKMWSEFNHNWAGVFVLAMGLLALANAAGRRWAGHWPLIFIAIGLAIMLRSDPESWPIGPKGFFETLADPEVFQHRAVGLLLFPFGYCEWAVRTGRATGERAALVFPILCAVGAALLLVHNHTLTDVKERFLIEFSHIPMGVLGVLAGWLRWLEIRGEGPIRRWAGLLWPVCFSLVGVLLIFYREM